MNKLVLLPLKVPSPFRKIILNQQIRRYATPSSKPKKEEASLGGWYSLTVVGALGVGTICLAKFSPDFREFVKEKSPAADSFFKVLLCEEKSYSEVVTDFTSGIYNKITGVLPAKKQRLESSTMEYQKEKDDINKHITLDISAKPNDKKIEPSEIDSEPKKIDSEPKNIRLMKKDDDSHKSEKQVSKLSIKPHYNVLEIELKSSAEEALQAYREAISSAQDFIQQVDNIMNSDYDQVDSKQWQAVRVKSEQKKATLKKAEETLHSALNNVDQLKRHILSTANSEATPQTVSLLHDSIRQVERRLQEAKSDYYTEIDHLKLAEDFWAKIELGRKHYQEELEILCPSVRLEDEKLHLSQEELDIFVMHARKSVLYLQKELAKLETKREAQLRQAIEYAKANDDSSALIEEKINFQIDKERRRLVEDFQKKQLEIDAQTDKQIRIQLKRQSEAHADHLAEALRAKEDEMKRNFERILQEESVKARLEYKKELAAMVGRVKGIDAVLTERAVAEKSAKQAQALWSASQTLYRALKNSIPGVSYSEQIRPLRGEINAIRKAAAEGDQLVQSVIASVPVEALDRGVHNEDILRERFLKVENVARKLALVPKEGAKIPVYLLSVVQSMLVIKPKYHAISSKEINDEVIDFSKLDTYDILNRARYWLDRGNFVQTLRYMNLLTGASRVIAEDWIRETKILLETQQVANTLLAHATALGLTYQQS